MEKKRSENFKQEKKERKCERITGRDRGKTGVRGRKNED